MGISGLLPFLEKATRPCHVSEFRGGSVAVDSYCFLHKGAISCAEQLARGDDNQMYVQYCIKYVKMLLSYDVHPIMVFDGRNLPAKAETEAKRRESRKKAKHRAAELLRLGKSEEARSYLKQCIDITPDMAHNLINECHKLNVDCIVSPYESDAQMAFFSFKGVAECIITEDSDLVLFGCKKVLYKLDLQGSGRLVEADKIYMTMSLRPDQFTFDKFRFMCILSGCDYVESLSGIGLKKAEKFLKLTAETNPEIFLDRIPRYLNMNHLVVTKEYKRNVLIANATFLHQIVFDPYKKKLVHLIDPEVTGTNPEYLINSGEKFDNEKAYQVALGNLNPYNFKKLDDWSPSDVSQYSIWSGIYKKRISRKLQKELQKSSLQKYISSGNSASSSMTRDEEQDIIEIEETQIEKDLSMYTRRVEIKEEIKETEVEVKKEEPDECQGTKLETSPVISKNPFLRKKRLSKFPKTYTFGNKVVKSRFFCSDSSVTKNENEVQITKSETVSEKPHLNSLESETYCDTFTIETRSVSTQNGSEEVLKSCENTTELASKIQHSNSVKSDTYCEEVLKSCENTTVSKKRSFGDVCSIEISDVAQELTQKEVKEEITSSSGSVKTTELPTDTKRRKLGTCRTVGLNRKQQTLHSFFGKLKNLD